MVGLIQDISSYVKDPREGDSILAYTITLVPEIIFLSIKGNKNIREADICNQLFDILQMQTTLHFFKIINYL